jgi:hypothetical protein
MITGLETERYTYGSRNDESALLAENDCGIHDASVPLGGAVCHRRSRNKRHRSCGRVGRAGLEPATEGL